MHDWVCVTHGQVWAFPYEGDNTRSKTLLLYLNLYHTIRNVIEMLVYPNNLWSSSQKNIVQ